MLLPIIVVDHFAHEYSCASKAISPPIYTFIGNYRQPMKLSFDFYIFRGCKNCNGVLESN